MSWDRDRDFLRPRPRFIETKTEIYWDQDRDVTVCSTLSCKRSHLQPILVQLAAARVQINRHVSDFCLGLFILFPLSRAVNLVVFRANCCKKWRTAKQQHCNRNTLQMHMEIHSKYTWKYTANTKKWRTAKQQRSRALKDRRAPSVASAVVSNAVQSVKQSFQMQYKV